LTVVEDWGEEVHQRWEGEEKNPEKKSQEAVAVATEE
jgi:hypothetical protein